LVLLLLLCQYRKVRGHHAARGAVPDGGLRAGRAAAATPDPLLHVPAAAGANIKTTRRVSREEKLTDRSVCVDTNHGGSAMQMSSSSDEHGLWFFVVFHAPAHSNPACCHLRLSPPAAFKKQAMSYCHRRGLFHRNLKPKHILLEANGTFVN
jgi:hypothetical protein